MCFIVNVNPFGRKVELMIVGNGLDVKANLASTFVDYYKHRCKLMRLEYNEDDFYRLENNNCFPMKVKMHQYFSKKRCNIEILSIDAEAVINENITFWDLVLFFAFKVEGDLNWCNIESKIEMVLKDLRSYLSDPINRILNNYGFGEKLEDDQEQESDLYNLMEEREEEKDKYALSLAFIYKLNSYSNSSLEEVLMLELNKYEKYFSDYIKTEETSKFIEYHERRCSILTKLSGGLEATQSISVMNFNFTPNHFSDAAELREKIGLAHVNVHGSYFGNSIFGIDTKSLKDIDSIGSGYRFTKTYRKLALKMKRSTEILNHNITDIIFYGHSLGPADYAYFQSVFDYLDIYNNPIVLTFYYSNYKENVREEQTIAVRNLIEEYGKTFDNIHKGKNLLHKLLLEERISVTDLEIYEEDYSSKDMK